MPDIDENNALLNLFAKFDLSINSLTRQVARANQLEQQRLATLPNYLTKSKMSSPGAAVTDVQDFDGPQPGRMWVVRLLTAIASPVGANASVVTWYVGQPMPGPAAGQLPATLARWQFPSVPNFQNFTSDVIKVYPGEHLIAGLTSIPASSFIALNVAINDQPLYAQTQAIAIE